MWGIFIGCLLFVAGFLFAPMGLLLTAAGMMLALVATARYTVSLLTPPDTEKQTIYDNLGTDATTPPRPAT